MSFSFNIHNNYEGARAGTLSVDGNEISTPVFMPVATKSAVRTLSSQDLIELNFDIILSNTYHLYLTPGTDVLLEFKGLHNFMNWPKSILTDSGGYQVFSLNHNTKISEDGVIFKSHIDGSSHFFSPESVMDIQRIIGSNIVMPLDHCIYSADNELAVKNSMQRTHDWLVRSVNSHDSSSSALFGIVQGGVYSDLRKESCFFESELDLPGYSIGGLAVGEDKATMYKIVDECNQNLPFDKPRYLMGVGSPEDLVTCVSLGVDMFDCVLPTRLARNGAIFTNAGRKNIKKSINKVLDRPLDDNCLCECCQNYSTGYIHQLFKVSEILGYRLATIHNLFFLKNLMGNIRKSILNNTFNAFKQEFLSNYQPTNEEARMAQKKHWLESRNIT
tara:strand:+ start:759 stop:1922 length:1164 start_codon:yes stop_codon:yes gene_type:complete